MTEDITIDHSRAVVNARIIHQGPVQEPLITLEQWPVPFLYFYIHAILTMPRMMQCTGTIASNTHNLESTTAP